MSPTGGITIRVLIVDDHPVVRNGLEAALASQPDIDVVGEARDGIEGEAMALQLNPDVVLMDLLMPNQDGIQTMLNLKNKLPELKVLFFTVSENDDDLLKAVRLGAEGFITKNRDLSDVVDAVRRVASGETMLSPLVTTRVMKELKENTAKQILSVREKEVLELISWGLTNAEIADTLSVSQGTVSTYIHRLLKKLHLKHRCEAISYTLRRGSRP